jgi:hypothetical protein
MKILVGGGAAEAEKIKKENRDMNDKLIKFLKVYILVSSFVSIDCVE